MLKAENDKLRNSRNLAAGTLGSLTLEDVKKRKLTFLAWDVIEGFEDNHSYSERLTLLTKYGFSITPFTLVNDLTIEKIDETNADILDLANLTSIPCDGVVWRIDDNLIGKEKGKTQHHFLNAVAWKPEDDEYETELLDIEWSMGRTGVLTPVAIYKDVEMDGCICNRANLFNYSTMVEKLGEYPYLHQKIYVTKKNKIIPYVTRAEDKGTDPHDHAFETPRTCPCCGEVVSLEETEG
jgi:DNA ligase (NAD+)